MDTEALIRRMMDNIEELEYRLARTERALLEIQFRTHIPIGVCLNASLDGNDHPHWDDNPAIDYTRPQIHIPFNVKFDLSQRQ